jgi:hypothetical protein
MVFLWVSSSPLRLVHNRNGGNNRIHAHPLFVSGFFGHCDLFLFLTNPRLLSFRFCRADCALMKNMCLYVCTTHSMSATHEDYCVTDMEVQQSSPAGPHAPHVAYDCDKMREITFPQEKYNCIKLCGVKHIKILWLYKRYRKAAEDKGKKN